MCVVRAVVCVIVLWHVILFAYYLSSPSMNLNINSFRLLWMRFIFLVYSFVTSISLDFRSCERVLVYAAIHYLTTESIIPFIRSFVIHLISVCWIYNCTHIPCEYTQTQTQTDALAHSTQLHTYTNETERKWRQLQSTTLPFKCHLQWYTRRLSIVLHNNVLCALCLLMCCCTLWAVRCTLYDVCVDVECPF